MRSEDWRPGDARAFARGALADVADRAKAEEMAAYMKHVAPFFGVSKPLQRPIRRELIERFPVTTRRQYERLVDTLWADDEREMKYLALAMARRWSAFHTVESMPLYERLVIEGGWWDLVDEIAVNLVGPAVRSDREAGWPFIDRWSASDDLWLRRTAILCQLKWREETDARRLFASCEAHLDEPDFFIRKAIGWALRTYARTDPESVRSFLRDHRERVSGLTMREATKHIGPL